MIKSSVEKKWKASVQMETLFQSINAVSFLLTNFIGFLPVGLAKWKALSYNSESEADGGRTTNHNSRSRYEYGCVRPFSAGISLIYPGIHEDH